LKAIRGSRTLSRRVRGATLGVAMGAALVPSALVAASPALADTKSDLAAAKSQLSALQGQIGQQVQALATVHAQLTQVATQLGIATAKYQKTIGDIARTQEDLRLTAARLDELRNQLNERAAATYREGVGSFLEIVLGSTSYSDFTDRIVYANSLSRADAALTADVQRTAAELDRKQLALSTMGARQRSALQELQSERKLVAQKLDDQQAALASLANARAQASALVERLHKVLQQEELLAAIAAVNGGLPIPFGQWAPLFLPKLGAPTCRNNLVLVVAWEATEYTMARFNPLATSYPMPGATTFNSSGVKNYTTLDQGITATVLTLESTNPAFNYAPIVRDLRACADPLVTADAINHSAYCTCTGSYPLTYLVPFVESNYDFYAKICTGC
jgi:peptidoglycan hydrolase CwlO-like protein